MMQSHNDRRPHKNFIAAAVEDRMARMQQAAALTASSPPSLPQQPSKPRREESTPTIDLTDDNDDKDPPTRSHNKPPRLSSPQNPVEEQPHTPVRNSSHSRNESPAGPYKMPNLLHTALEAATSPKASVKSPNSPAEDVANRKRKRETPPRVESNPQSLQASPDSLIADEGRRKKRGRPTVDSSLGPVEQAEGPAASGHDAVESPRSPLEHRNDNVVTTETRVDSPRSPIQEADQSEQHLRATARGTSALDATSKKPEDELTHTEVSDRFVPQTIDGVEWRDPAKFSLKPPYWRAWDSKLYVELAEDLRYQYDPTRFAKKTGMPVEEIAHLFNAVVCDPLYDAKEATKRGEEGMREIMELYRSKKYSTPKRPWGKEEEGKKRWLAEIKGVKKGEVELVLAKSGNKKVLTLADLGEKDLKYLRDNLREEDRDLLWS